MKYTTTSDRFRYDDGCDFKRAPVPHVLLPIALCLSILIFSSFARADEFPNTIDAHPSISLQLGQGLNPNFPQRTTSECIQFQSKLGERGANKTRIDTYVVRSNREMRTVLGVDGSVEAKVLDFGGSASSTLNIDMADQTRNLFVVVKAYSLHPSRTLTKGTLTPDAQKLIEARNFRKFSEICGTHYVQSEERKNEVNLILTYSDVDSNFISSLHTSISAKGAFGPIGGEVKSSLNLAISKHKQDWKSELSVDAVGGKGFVDAAELIADGVTTTRTPAELEKALVTFFRSFNPEDAGSYRYGIASMRKFGYEPEKVDLWSERKDMALQSIVDQYRRVETMAKVVDEALDPSDRRRSLFRPDVILSTADDLRQTPGYLRSLAKMHAQCMETPVEAMEAVCEADIPEEAVGLTFMYNMTRSFEVLDNRSLR